MPIEDSIVLITSADPDNRKFGTGFIVHTDAEGDYVVTCRHVVVDTGADTRQGMCLNYREYPILDLFMNTPDDPDDLAILKIRGSLGRPPLVLRSKGRTGDKVRIFGYYRFSTNPDSHRRIPVNGELGERGTLHFRTRQGHMVTWDLKIEETGTLQEGFSGSPVIREEAVTGVVSHRIRKGQMGVAISIEALFQLWPEIAPLLNRNSQETGNRPSKTPAPQASTDGLKLNEIHQIEIQAVRAKVFISYAKEDGKMAKRLYKDLKKAGMVPWMDKVDLIPGQNWKVMLNQAIQGSDFFVALLSAKSVVKRGYVQKEFNYALEVLDRIPPNEIFVIPVRLDACRVPYEKLRDIHWVDLFEDYDEGLNAILRALGHPNIKKGLDEKEKPEIVMELAEEWTEDQDSDEKPEAILAGSESDESQPSINLSEKEEEKKDSDEIETNRSSEAEFTGIQSEPLAEESQEKESESMNERELEVEDGDPKSATDTEESKEPPEDPEIEESREIIPDVSRNDESQSIIDLQGETPSQEDEAGRVKPEQSSSESNRPVQPDTSSEDDSPSKFKLFAAIGAAIIAIVIIAQILKKEPTSPLTIKTNPAGAILSVDQEYRGETPITIENLTIGETVHISIEKEGFETAEDWVTIGDGHNTKQIDLQTQPKPSRDSSDTEPEKHAVTVRSNVYGDTVFIDGQEYGPTPLDIELNDGTHAIRVEKPNYIPFAEEVDVKGPMTIRASLEPGPPPSEEPDTLLEGRYDMKFAYIPAGEFKMGSPEDEPGRSSDESPQHKVTISQGFYMQTTEVTQGQWKAVMGENPSLFKNCGDNCPVENVSWENAKEFIQILNKKEGRDLYRLPTEAEWEYAARAGSRTAFANGAIQELECGLDPNLDQMGWYCGNSEVSYEGCYDLTKYKGSKCAGPHPVAIKQPNQWGLFDMHGNVWEWCEDDWHGDYKEAPNDGRAWIDEPNRGGLRVLRGGSWYYYARYCRSALRNYREPGDRFNDVGFRLARSYP